MTPFYINALFIFVEAKYILTKPEQLLADDEEESKIRVRWYIAPEKRILVIGEKTMNIRQLKRACKKWGAIESCIALDDEKCQYIVEFTDREGS